MPKVAVLCENSGTVREAFRSRGIDAVSCDLLPTDLPGPHLQGDICLENPVSIISSKIRKPDQIIQPYEYGHPESKKTCLWLKGLPLLRPTNQLVLPKTDMAKRIAAHQETQKAFAAQWGSLPILGTTRS